MSARAESGRSRPGRLAAASRMVRRIVAGALRHEVGTAAAAVAFFVLLGFFPGLGAVVTLVSVMAETSRVQDILASLAPALPPGAAEVLRDEFARFAELASNPGRRQALVTVPYIGFAILVLSSNKGTKALLNGLNRVYAADETRGYLRFTALSLCFTLGLIVIAPMAVGGLVVVPRLLDYLGPEILKSRHVQWLRWPVLLLLVAGLLALMYRYGPSRGARSWGPILAGSALGAALWGAGSALLSVYLARFGNLPVLYGSLSAVVGLVLWIWVSAIAVLIGAEFDAALSGGSAGEDGERES